MERERGEEEGGGRGGWERRGEEREMGEEDEEERKRNRNKNSEDEKETEKEKVTMSVVYFFRYSFHGVAEKLSFSGLLCREG